MQNQFYACLEKNVCRVANGFTPKQMPSHSASHSDPGCLSLRLCPRSGNVRVMSIDTIYTHRATASCSPSFNAACHLFGWVVITNMCVSVDYMKTQLRPDCLHNHLYYTFWKSDALQARTTNARTTYDSRTVATKKLGEFKRQSCGCITV